MAAMTGFSPAAALYFARLNSWRYLGREVEADGDVLDWYAKSGGSAVVLHTQSGQAPRHAPGFVIDRLPGPWVGAVPGDPPFVGYVVQFPPQSES
jgi:hypothetical protein